MAKKKSGTVEVRLLFVDEGAYHHETAKIPTASVKAYDRLIDCLREDEDVLAKLHVDVERLVSAHLVEG
ncbi:MAG: hypothetical protein HKN72_00430 [Gemmatimonadetes bacterium]|nr:hypothetical protein [Gemmatimonadota bacterium]